MFFLLPLQVRLVRVTKRVHEAYFAQLYLTKVCIIPHTSVDHFFALPKGGIGSYFVVIEFSADTDGCGHRWETTQIASALIFDLQMLSTLQ